MPKENEDQNQEFLELDNIHTILVIPGAFTTHPRSEHIANSLRKMFSNVQAKRSEALLGIKKSGGHIKHEDLAKTAFDALNNNNPDKKVVFVLHSFAVNEIGFVLEEFKKKCIAEGVNYEDLKNRISMIFISPYGLIDGLHKALKLARVLTLNLTQQPLPTPHKGIESFHYVPFSFLLDEQQDNQEDNQENISVDEFYNRMHQKMGKASVASQKYMSDNRENVLMPTETNPYFEGLDDEVKETLMNKIREIDAKILKALQKKNKFIFKYYLGKRGLIVSKNSNINQLYDNVPLANEDDKAEGDKAKGDKTEQENEQEKISPNEHSLIYYCMQITSGKTKKQFQDLIAEDFRIGFMVPQYDVIFKLSEIQKIMGKEKTDFFLMVMAGATHNSIRINEKDFAVKIREFIERWDQGQQQKAETKT